jgi:hypothetical protein
VVVAEGDSNGEGRVGARLDSGVEGFCRSGQYEVLIGKRAGHVTHGSGRASRLFVFTRLVGLSVVGHRCGLCCERLMGLKELGLV